jgi:hypothetical protein
MDRKWLVLLSAAVAAVGAYLLFRKPTPTVPQVGSGVLVSQEGAAIFTRPEGVTEAPLLIVYGGLTKFPWARKKAMAEYVPQEISLRTFGLFLDHKDMGVVDAVSLARSLAGRYGLKIRNVKAMGFSAGAIPVQDAVGEAGDELVFVGLIDPSTRAQFVTANFGNRGRMLYNAGNWGAYPAIKAAMPRVAARITEQGGVAKELKLSHAAFPVVFFETFKDELVK